MERPLEDVIKNVISGFEKKGRPSEEEMLEVWEDAVGRKAFAHAHPVSFRKASLVVNVDGSGWLYELTTRKKEILKKIEGRLGGKKIKDIRFRIGEVKKPAHKD